jgi:cytochrome c oxidase subunit 3
MSEEIAPHVHFQYSTARHQADTAISGMWLFLATEVLFFGGLILVWTVSRHWQPAGFDAGGRQTVIAIGTINLALLLCSSFIYTTGQVCIEAGQSRLLERCCWATAAIGVAFLALKIFEWHIDLTEHLFPAGRFAIGGANDGGARMFWTFYFIATGLHAVHMIVGIALVAWIAHRARRGEFSAAWYTPVEVVGLYWSFVDIVWIVLYPLIYLVGRVA